MALIAVDHESRVDEIIRKSEPRIRNALTTAIVTMKDQVELKTLLDLIEFGRLDDAVNLASEVGAIRLADEVIGTYVLAGKNSAEFLSDALGVVVSFDQTNFRAVDLMRQERLRLIQGFTAEQRNATRAAIVDGIERGDNPLKQAKNFKDSLGLTAQQYGAVENYRKLLETGSSEALTRDLRDKRSDRSIKSAIKSGEALSASQIENMVGRYRDNYIKFRAEAIARTEALRAVHSASDEAYQQAIDAGKLAPSQLVRMWVTAQDGGVRDTHSEYNGQERGMDGMWGPLRHPGDPSAPGRETINCRCSMTTRISTV